MLNDTRLLSLDENTRLLVEEKFQYKRELAKEKEKELFGVFDGDLTQDEELALKYLFAYMPINDLADYDGSLFLDHVRKVLHIQSVVPWGDKVPSSTFLHFILPYRVNNENIEDVRGLLFAEIFPRVQGMSMEEAILETNHWCHEKANYIGNDRRTVSPLTLIRTALGRCGEQSTLAVSALRSICIPARQVYTPLWAHSDSNHAWVESWADGQWHFFGACEPEPRLNQGWFQRPAKRAMLIHTRVHANYHGPEEVTLAHPWYSELNLTGLYAETKSIKVRITDGAGNPTAAKVQFQLFNFGALSPILTKETDEHGQVDVTLGLGDVYISASGDLGWGTAKLDVRSSNEITIRLSEEIPVNTDITLKMAPPPDLPEDPSLAVSSAEKERHNERVKAGASIRADYEATFLTEHDAEELGQACSLPASRVWEVLKHARGNSQEIASFLQECSPLYGEWSLRLLEVLNEKDLTDTFRPTLADHLTFAMNLKKGVLANLDDEVFAQYVLRPRVDAEMITPYRAFFTESLSETDVQLFLAKPPLLIEWLDDHFEVLRNVTFYNGSATPVGSFSLKKGDPLSRDILFVAIARSIGIPARLEPTDKRPQFYQDGVWHNAQFRDSTAGVRTDISNVQDPLGIVELVKDPQSDEKINYYRNFTIARFTNGTFQTLSYPFGEMENEKLELPAGHYRTLTSTRLTDGTALLHLHCFEVEAGKTVSIPVTFPSHEVKVPVIADANLDCEVETMNGQTEDAANLLGSDGTTFVWIEPDREPSKHLLREFREMKNEWESLAVNINCFVPENKWELVSSLHSAGDLPKNLAFFKESNNLDALHVLGKHLAKPVNADTELPVVLVLDENNQIRHISEGYKLGISRDVIDVYKQISQS